ncbi:XdhC family protein [Aliikangiella coralliicola]|uniref:XdhC family protein n=1 Tax=Aliikangiella coralliicola TaxID=2592383 RepID=A0A545U6E6_9GAMM|nr:XdhC/CoxI family protein [Aliikangiella coralliicola]TQV85045.1 XdhC family protein [Aliikangiella coralliicola]
MLNLLTSLKNFDQNSDYVLAVILDTQGSTYRKTGAMMLLNSSLDYWGLISGGCLEGDIQQHSAEVFKQKKDKILHYDMRGDEDLLWGMGLGCDGAINVLLKYLPATENHLGFFEILNRVSAGQDHLLIIDRVSINSASASESPLHNSFSYLALKKRQATIKIDNQEVTIASAPWLEKSSQQLVIPFNAPLNILICGASPDVPPVTSLAQQLGWQTTIIDHRKDFASAGNFPAAHKVVHVKRSQWETFELENFDAVVVMSHQFERDQAYLSRLIDSPVQYIGLLGPSKRRDKLLEECGTAFADHEGRIFGPVGLDIGADSPETIALAIVAEIQAVKTKKDVGFCYQDKTR